jgi:hypothetical protein
MLPLKTNLMTSPFINKGRFIMFFVITNICLKARIIAAMKNIDAPMLTRVWQELEYRIDVCLSPVVHTSNTSSC